MDAEFSEIINKMGILRAKTKSYNMVVSELFDPMIKTHSLPVLREYLHVKFGLGVTHDANGYGEVVTIKELSLFRHSWRFYLKDELGLGFVYAPDKRTIIRFYAGLLYRAFEI